MTDVATKHSYPADLVRQIKEATPGAARLHEALNQGDLAAPIYLEAYWLRLVASDMTDDDRVRAALISVQVKTLRLKAVGLARAQLEEAVDES